MVVVLHSMWDMFNAWYQQAEKLESGEITKEEYDRWRYRYPELDTPSQWHKITPSQELSNLLANAFTKGETKNE